MPTLPLSTRTLRILGALVIAAAVMTLAYALSGPSIFSSKLAGAESTEELLREFSSRDTDADGLPDWQEALYGTDPDNAHSFSQELTDGEAANQGLIEPKFRTDLSGLAGELSVPGVDAADGTVTATFARDLFTNYMNSRTGTPPSAEEVNAFMQEALTDLASKQRSVKAYSLGNVRVSGSGTEALRAYAVAAERAFGANTVDTDKNELYYFTDAVQKGDADAMNKVRAIGRAYKNIAAALIQVQVPHDAQTAHLNVANSLAYLSVVVENMASVDADPLRGMLGMTEYKSAADSMVRSYAELDAAFKNSGLTIGEGEPGYYFVNAAANAAAAVPNL